MSGWCTTYNMKRKGSLPKYVSINNIKQLYNKDKIYHQQAKIPETESLNSLLKGKGEHERGRAELRGGINASKVCRFYHFKLHVSQLFMWMSPQRLCHMAGVRPEGRWGWYCQGIALLLGWPCHLQSEFPLLPLLPAVLLFLTPQVCRTPTPKYPFMAHYDFWVFWESWQVQWRVVSGVS